MIVDVLPSGQDVADSIKEADGQAEFIQCDLSDVDQLLAMLPRAISSFGASDILVNNALHLHTAPIADFPLEEWEKTFDTNARAIPHDQASPPRHVGAGPRRQAGRVSDSRP